MNTATLAQSAYSQATAITPSSRDTEYRAFAEVTKRLAQNIPVTPQNFARVAESIHLNQRLWVLLAADVADAGNALPDSLRAQIFYLAEFTRVHSSKVLQEDASPDVLVEINTSIMRGLRASQGEP